MTTGQGTALVTGGAKGIGRAISEELASCGWNVVITGRDQAAISAVVEDIGDRHQRGVQVIGKALDVTSLESVESVFTEVATDLGPLSALVNCAGVIARGPAEELSDKEWRQVIDTDVTGVFRCCKAAFEGLSRGNGGAIVNIGSVAAGIGLSGRVAYTTSKAALDGLTRTEMVAGGIASGQLSEQALTARIPQQRLAEPAEIAKVVAFLASADASYVTGQSVVVDGGFSVNGNS